MTFLQPLLLWGGLAASVPVIIHLLNRRRHRTMPWAAMQFLLRATRESRGKKRLKHILILLCRALGLAALAVAVAQPMVGGFLGWGGGAIDTVVLVLDRSASMEARPAGATVSRRAAALEQVSAALGELGGARLVLLDSATGRPQEVPSPEVLAGLSAVAPTDTAADIPGLLAQAVDFLGDTAPGRTEVWVASDLQSEDWNPESDRWQAVRAGLGALPQPPVLRILAMAGDPAPNTSLRTTTVRRAGERLEVEFELLRQDDPRQTVEIPFTLAVDGVRTTDLIQMRGDSRRFVRQIQLPEGLDEGFGWASIPADSNPRDNSTFFAFGPARPLRTAVVAEAGEAAQFLALAAAPPGLPGREVEVVAPPAAATLRWDNLAAVLWAAPLPEGALAERAGRFVADGGTIVFLAPGAAGVATVAGVAWGAPDAAAQGRFFIAADWNRDDGLLRDGLDGTPLAVGSLRAIRRQAIAGEAAVIARWDDGEPLLVRQVSDRGTAWFLTTLPDYGWSNLGDGDVLLPAVQRALSEGADRFDSGHLASVGAAAARPVAGGPVTRVADCGTPDPANALFEAGVRRVDGRMVAVNRPPAEDMVEQLPPETLGRVLEGIDFSLFREPRTADSATLARQAWRAFVIAMIFFLIAEALLCLPPKPAAEPAPGAEPIPPRPGPAPRTTAIPTPTAR